MVNTKPQTLFSTENVIIGVVGILIGLFTGLMVGGTDFDSRLGQGRTTPPDGYTDALWDRRNQCRALNGDWSTSGPSGINDPGFEWDSGKCTLQGGLHFVFDKDGNVTAAWAQ